ncbi:MAG: sodium:solute symporter family protein, partial [Desulfovibrio sp.]|nr:sodium:solute symporter family protein [Desulfovibrio sp.]
MTILVFSFFILLSLFLAFLAKRSVITNNIHDILVASRSLGGFLLFFITLGEIYGIGTMIGVPGAVYSKGSSYVVWFIAYILLAYPVGYFINPRIWRIGKVSNASTMGDFFAWRFESKWLGFIIAILSMVVLLPWAQMQFVGLSVILRYLGVEINTNAAICLSAVIAFMYVGLCGVKGSAYVAILKDLLMVSAIIIGGVLAASHMPGGVEGIFREALVKYPEYLTIPMEPIDKHVTFVISTIIVQSLGLYMVPFIFQYIFSGGSEKIVRFNQLIMPLYMLMYAFLVTAAFYCLVTVPGLKNPDDAFMGMIVANAPPWIVGLCAAAGALTCMLVLADVALGVSGILTRNILTIIAPQASQAKMVNWARICIALFLGG